MKKVAVIHGVFMNKYVMRPLALRLEQSGLEVLTINYNSFNFSLSTIFRQLDDFFKDADDCAIVGWSLGGLIAREYLQSSSMQATSLTKVITLGTPHRRSDLAKFFFFNIPSKLRPGATSLLLDEHNTWSFNCELHSIAGNNNKGIFWLLTSKTSDGTVEVSETKIHGMVSHSIFHTTHSGLVFSKPVAEKVISLLKESPK